MQQTKKSCKNIVCHPESSRACWVPCLLVSKMVPAWLASLQVHVAVSLPPSSLERLPCWDVEQ
jgi:hypothetical protein